MAETKRIIKFTVDKKTKVSMQKKDTVFALYAPRRIKLEPGHFVNVPINKKLELPQNIIGTTLFHRHLQILESK